MRYRLRTLLILLAVGPPLVAIAVWSFRLHRFPGLPLTFAVLSIPVFGRALRAGRNPFIWTASTWILGYACAFALTFAVAVIVVKGEIWPDVEPKILAVSSALIGGYAGASIVFAGAGRSVFKRSGGE
jgi:hypothetical protein